MSDKDEATRLADHIDVCGSDISAWRLMREAAALLRRWPDAREPVALDAIYAAWHGAGVDIAGGNWKRFAGMLPPLYTAPTDQSERIAALEEERDHYKMAAKAEADFADRYKAKHAALKAALEQARGAIEALQHHNGAGSQQLADAALRAIEETRGC